MKIIVNTPSRTEATVLPAPNHDSICMIEPHRWNQQQRQLSVCSLSACNDAGTLLDSAVVMVNQKTGKLYLAHMEQESIPCDADKVGGTNG